MARPHEKELSELEKLLAALPPRPTTLDRDHLLFRAGQVSMRRSWLWPFAAVVMSVASGCLAMVLLLRPVPEPVERIVRVEVPVPVPGPPLDDWRQPQTLTPYTSDSVGDAPSPTLSYWRMQQQALRFGVEGLPEATASGDEAPSATVRPGAAISAGSRPRLYSFTLLPFGVR